MAFNITLDDLAAAMDWQGIKETDFGVYGIIYCYYKRAKGIQITDDVVVCVDKRVDAFIDDAIHIIRTNKGFRIEVLETDENGELVEVPDPDLPGSEYVPTHFVDIKL